MTSLERPQQVNGMPVILVPVNIRPKIELSENVDVSDEFRAEFNAWSTEMFGAIDLTLLEKGTALRAFDADDFAMSHITGMQRYRLMIREDDWPLVRAALDAKERTPA